LTYIMMPCAITESDDGQKWIQLLRKGWKINE